MGPVKTEKQSYSNQKDNPNKLTRFQPIPIDVLLKLVDDNYSLLDICDYFGCGREKVSKTLRQMETSTHGYKQGGVVIDRALKEKYKPYHLKRVLRKDYLEKPFVELNSAENVPAPLSLTHFGTFPKFIRWGFFINGGLDIYSRYITFLEISPDNDAQTVLSHFRKGVAEKGLPVSVKCDDREEVAGVIQFMNLNRADVDNRVQYERFRKVNRITHLWRDVLRFCLQPYRLTFKEMEANGKLNSRDPVDIYCLHQCYLHLMKDALVEFTNKWNKHQICVAGKLTPKQLFMVGIHKIQRQAGLEGVHFPELDEREIIEVDSNQEWPPSATPSIYRRVLKKKKDRAELRLQFPQESITVETAPKIYLKMRRKVNKMLNLSA